MKPTFEEIRRILPTSDPEDQFVYIESDVAIAAGLIEAVVIHIREFGVKLFRFPNLRKIVFVVIMSVSALDGLQVYAPNNSELDIVIKRLADSRQWTQNIQLLGKPELQGKYYAFGSPGEPTPPDVTFKSPNAVILAPITGAGFFLPNINYFAYDPSRGISSGVA